MQLAGRHDSINSPDALPFRAAAAAESRCGSVLARPSNYEAGSPHATDRIPRFKIAAFGTCDYPPRTGHYLKTSRPPFMAQSFRPRRGCGGPASYWTHIRRSGGSRLEVARRERHEGDSERDRCVCECCVGVGACDQGWIGEGVAATIIGKQAASSSRGCSRHVVTPGHQLPDSPEFLHVGRCAERTRMCVSKSRAPRNKKRPETAMGCARRWDSSASPAPATPQTGSSLNRVARRVTHIRTHRRPSRPGNRLSVSANVARRERTPACPASRRMPGTHHAQGNRARRTGVARRPHNHSTGTRPVAVVSSVAPRCPHRLQKAG